MAKQKFKIINWKTYNHALRQRGSLIVWIGDDATAAWYGTAEPALRYADTAIVTALMLKSVFNLTLRALQGFIDSVFHLMNESGLPPESLAETAMSRMKMMFGERLSLRDSIADNKTQRLMKNIG